MTCNFNGAQACRKTRHTTGHLKSDSAVYVSPTPCIDYSLGQANAFITHLVWFLPTADQLLGGVDLEPLGHAFPLRQRPGAAHDCNWTIGQECP